MASLAQQLFPPKTILLVRLCWLSVVQVNNQPPVLGQMALACDVIHNTTAAGGSALDALAAVSMYFWHNGNSQWCLPYSYDPNQNPLVDYADSYSYQCCTEGTVYSSLLPAQPNTNTLNPENLPAPLREIEDGCR